MKKSFSKRRLLIACVILTISVLSARVIPEARAQQRLRAPQNVRAVWVRPFIDADEAVRGDKRAGQAFIRRELERIKRAGIDTVYVESFFDGYAMYPSKFVAMRPLNIKYGIAAAAANSNGAIKSWDVLQTYIDEGRKQGLNIHAWFEVFFVWNTGLGDVSKSPIFSRHPDWLALDNTGSPLVHAEAEGANKEIDKVFMSPSHAGVRAFLKNLVGEIATNYPQLSGVQLDYIRYPSHTANRSFDYSPDALRQFKTATGLDAKQLSITKTPKDWERWQDWKTAQVTNAVREMAAVIRQANPHLILSAAVFPDFAQDLKIKMQDARAWSQEGLVDALLPMLYSTDFARVDAWAKEFRSGIEAGKTRVYPALYINHFYQPKSGAIDNRYLQLASKYNFDGTGFFAAQLLTDDLIQSLAASKTPFTKAQTK